MKCALITGIEGFAGSHLAELLLRKGYRVYGTVLDIKKTRNINHLLPRIKILQCDITDYEALKTVVKRSNPDIVFHLAGVSSLPHSLVQPELTYRVNFWGTYNVLEVIRNYYPDARVLIAGSAHEYGRVESKDLPVKEEHPLKPETPYGASKAAAEMLALQYYRSFGIKTYPVRSFNHIGPRQGTEFVLSNFAKQIADILKGVSAPVIRTGNLKVYRDFTDVRDVVYAYLLLVNKGKSGEVYNVCSGRGYLLLDLLKEMLKIAKCEARIKVEGERVRRSEMVKFFGDNSKLKRDTGWKPNYDIRRTLKDLLEWSISEGMKTG